jgi:hypothetical protein
MARLGRRFDRGRGDDLCQQLHESNTFTRMIAAPQAATGFVFQPDVIDQNEVTKENKEYLIHISQAGCFAFYIVAGLLVVYVIVPYTVIKAGSSGGGKSSSV